MEREINSKHYIENVEKGYFGNQPTLPNSIPSTSGFVGREDYLADLREHHQNGTRSFVLHGAGGFGKTATALQFAGEIAGGYAAKIFVEMNGMSENPLSARDAMFDVVRQFEREIPTDISDAQLKELFIQFVQNQPTLMVLDNAVNKESVESLMQVPACFIITSREAFALTVGEDKRLLKMSPEDARKLLHKIAGEERFDGRADELAQLAGYLPMALKPLASILREDKLETAADLINKYRDKKELLKERVPDYNNLTIEASFELSYKALSDEMKKHWRRLSVFHSGFSDTPTDFTGSALAVVLEIDENEAKNTQKLLRRYSLLEVNSKTNRFYLHDLAQVFAKTKLSEEECFNTEFLFAFFYCCLLGATVPMVKYNPQNGVDDVVNLLKLEWANIEVGQKWTACFTEKDDETARLCCSYANSISGTLGSLLKTSEIIRWYEDALKAARKLRDRVTEGIITGCLGIAYFNLENFSQAIEYYEKALETTPQMVYEFTDPQIKGKWLFYLGKSYFKLNKKEKACGLWKEALVCFEAIESSYSNDVRQWIEENC